MSEYDETQVAYEVDGVFLGVDAADSTIHDVWNQYHQNRFWDLYTDTPGNACPSCASLDYEINRQELHVIGQKEPVDVKIWYECNDCGGRWTNTEIDQAINHEDRS